jgi:beta-lactam-binding protein with PASTA domain
VGGVSAMSISPADDAKVAQGEAHEITVSGVTVAPQVSVKGPASFEILVGAGTNQYVVRIKVAADAKGTVDVTISDRGLATEEVQLTVGTPAAK